MLFLGIFVVYLKFKTYFLNKQPSLHLCKLLTFLSSAKNVHPLYDIYYLSHCLYIRKFCFTGNSEKFPVKQKTAPYQSCFQTVDKLGVGCYAQHHFSFKTSFLFIFFKINKNLAVFQPRFSRIFASFFRFMHAKVSPAFISIRAFPTYCV